MSEEQYKSLVEKIKKLFALSKGNTTEEEAASAIAKAQALMLQYNIEQEDLAASEVEDIIELDVEISKRFNIPATSLASALGKAFMVRPLIVKTKTGYHKIRFIGSITDVQTVKYIFDYVNNLADVKSKDYFENKVRYTKNSWTPSSAKKVKSDYEYGFISSVNANLKKITEEREKANPYEAQVTQALVVVKSKRVDDYVNQTQGKIGTDKRTISYNKNHFENGSIDGSKVGLYKGVSSKADNQLCIGG